MGNANVGARQAAQKMFCEIYKHIGDAINSFTNGIKESTLKVLTSDFAKTTKYESGTFVAQRHVLG
jgi:hypothetical protein